MELEGYLKNRLEEKELLLMTHIVLGYPSFDDSFRIIEAMVEAGVDLMELQIPFSEPTADGPVIVRANQEALERGATVKDCLKFTETVTQRFDIPFLIMSYYSCIFLIISYYSCFFVIISYYSCFFVIISYCSCFFLIISYCS